VLRGLGDLTEIVGRHIRRHADRDPRRAIDQQVRESGREDGRFLETVVEVRNERNRRLVDVLKHGDGHRREPCLRVAVGRRTVAVDRSEVPLAIHQRIAQREVLHHPHECIVDGHVPVGVVLTEDVAHDRRTLLVRTTGLKS
jgi:hypothetical protein